MWSTGTRVYMKCSLQLSLSTKVYVFSLQVLKSTCEDYRHCSHHLGTTAEAWVWYPDERQWITTDPLLDNLISFIRCRAQVFRQADTYKPTQAPDVQCNNCTEHRSMSTSASTNKTHRSMVLFHCWHNCPQKKTHKTFARIYTSRNHVLKNS